VESEVGVGSVFWIEIISTTAPDFSSPEFHEIPAVPQHFKESSEPRTMVYVEDNPANLKLVEQLIARRPDMRLFTAVNGNLGVELVRKMLPRMVLMDINLPDINGFEALKILREDATTAHIPVVALSAN